MQVIASGALRGLKDTRVPLVVGIFSYGVIGLGSGYCKGIYLNWGSVGLWLGLVFGFLAAGVLLSRRFYKKTANLQKFAIPENSSIKNLPLKIIFHKGVEPEYAYR